MCYMMLYETFYTTLTHMKVKNKSRSMIFTTKWSTPIPPLLRDCYIITSILLKI